MPVFQTDLKTYNVGHIRIEGYVYSTEDPAKAAFLRKNLSNHLWEIKANAAGETVIKMTPKVKTVRGARTSEMKETQEEKKE